VIKSPGVGAFAEEPINLVEERSMNGHFGWTWWEEDAELVKEKDGWRIFKKDGYVTEVGPGGAPGDADCPIWRDNPDRPYSYE
jgi:hypothetical protein